MIKVRMEQRYKNALRQIYKDKLSGQIRPNSYAEGLFSASSFYRIKLESPELKHSKTKVITPDIEHKTVTEKTLILDSLHQFSKEKLEDSKSNSLAVEGGELILKNPKPASEGFINEFNLDEADLSTLFNNSELSTQAYAETRLSNKEEKNINVVFVSDSFITNLETKNLKTEIEFYTLFNGETAVMFSKMVKAMELSSSQYLLSAVKLKESSSSNDYLEYLLREILTLKPKLVVSMGITASEAILHLNKRLKEIHGRFYKIKINDFTTEVMPLFSPNLLSTAVNMKKIAWEDMQKAMVMLTP